MIRPFNEADVDELVDVWYRSSRIAYSFLADDFFTTEQNEIVERWLPIADTTVAELDGRVVGFLSLIGNEVGAFFVDPDRQGQGIGRALMDHARGSRPFLELDVFEANALGRRFYDAYGFVVQSEHEHEVTGHNQLRLRLG